MCACAGDTVCECHAEQAKYPSTGTSENEMNEMPERRHKFRKSIQTLCDQVPIEVITLSFYAFHILMSHQVHKSKKYRTLYTCALERRSTNGARRRRS